MTNHNFGRKLEVYSKPESPYRHDAIRRNVEIAHTGVNVELLKLQENLAKIKKL
jgi:hypothetical protein